MRAALAVLSLALLAGCPSPPNEATPGAGAPGGPGGGRPGGGGPGGPGAGGPGAGGPGAGGPGAGGPGAGGPGAGGAPGGGGGPGAGGGAPGGPPPDGAGDGAVMRLDVPVRTPQDEISDPIILSGTVKGSCEGKLVLDIVPPPPDAPPEPGTQPDEGGEALGGPLTRAELSAPGAFSMKAPKGAKGALSAICDANADGVIGRGDLVSEAVEFAALTAAVSDLELVLGPANLPDGPPKDGKGVGGGAPPAGGAPAGDAPPVEPPEPTPPG